MSNNNEIRKAYHVDWACAWISVLTSGMLSACSGYILTVMNPAMISWGALAVIAGFIFAEANLLVSVHCAQKAGQLEPILKGRLDASQS